MNHDSAIFTTILKQGWLRKTRVSRGNEETLCRPILGEVNIR